MGGAAFWVIALAKATAIRRWLLQQSPAFVGVSDEYYNEGIPAEMIIQKETPMANRLSHTVDLQVSHYFCDIALNQTGIRLHGLGFVIYYLYVYCSILL